MSVEAEKGVLASILLNAEYAWPIASEILSKIERPFSVPEHQEVWESMLALDATNTPIDIKLLDCQKHCNMLKEILSAFPTTAYTKHYAEKVLSEAVHHHMFEAVDDAARRFKGKQIATSDIAEGLSQRLGNLMTETGDRAKVLDAATAADRLLTRTRDMVDRGASFSGVPTGLRQLDAVLLGMQPEDMIVLAARPSVGKTALSLQIMRHVALEANHPCLMFSLEMSTETLMVRHAQATDGLLTERLRVGWQAKPEVLKLESAAKRWTDAKCEIADVPGMSALQMRNIARRFRAKHGTEIGLVIIDYMQLMSGDKRQPRESQVAEISRNIKALAREIHWPVLTLSQLNRGVDETQEPQLSNLRESGAIEQDADVVLLMHKPKQTEGEHWVSVRVAKHRNGALGLASLWFDKQKQTFRDGNDENGIMERKPYISAKVEEFYDEPDEDYAF